jgi:serine/threonine protein kinase
VKICLSCDGVAATAQERCATCDVPLLPTTAVHFPIRRGEVDTGNPLLGGVIDGKFLLQSVLGRGGMGTVFRACHAVSQVPVAVKLLHPRLSVRPEYRRSLLAEARKAGRVVHDQCARVLDVGETDEGTVYLAMELAEGETLDAWVRDGPLPPAVALDVLTQIAEALVAIHAAGLVHRDLSSRNVMIALRGGAPVVKVLDFGIAQTMARASSVEERGAGEVAFANPVFSAPEHLAGQDVDARADIYSFGVVAYELLAGKLPHAVAPVLDALAGRAAPPAPPLATACPQLSADVCALIDRCLDAKADARPTAEALGAALSRART